MLLSYVLPVEADNRVSYAGLVNTMIGTKGAGWASGYTYPGATYPFGMVQFTRSYFCPHLGAVGATAHISDGLMVAVDCAHGSVQRLQA